MDHIKTTKLPLKTSTVYDIYVAVATYIACICSTHINICYNAKVAIYYYSYYTTMNYVVSGTSNYIHLVKTVAVVSQ